MNIWNSNNSTNTSGEKLREVRPYPIESLPAVRTRLSYIAEARKAVASNTLVQNVNIERSQKAAKHTVDAHLNGIAPESAKTSKASSTHEVSYTYTNDPNVQNSPVTKPGIFQNTTSQMNDSAEAVKTEVEPADENAGQLADIRQSVENALVQGAENA